MEISQTIILTEADMEKAVILYVKGNLTAYGGEALKSYEFEADRSPITWHDNGAGGPPTATIAVNSLPAKESEELET